MQKTSDKDIKSITDLYTVEKKKIAEISVTLGIASTTIFGILQRLGLWEREGHQRITQADIEKMTALYLESGNVWEVAKKMNMAGQTVHRHLAKAGVIQTDRFSIEEMEIIKTEYKKTDGEFSLSDLAIRLNRTSSGICRIAKLMGLTTYHRNETIKIERLKKLTIPGHWGENHPRGMKDKFHSDESKTKMSASQKKRAENTPPEVYKEQSERAIATKIKKYGHAGNNQSKNIYSRCKRGIREDLGPISFRSSWEANYARYLNYLIKKGDILKWEFEPMVFVFHGEIRGAVSYLPDFRVTTSSGSIEYHEVKGWMDAKSKSKLKKMAKFYPNEVLLLIDSKVYYKLEKEYKSILPFWEVRAKR